MFAPSYKNGIWPIEIALAVICVRRMVDLTALEITYNASRKKVCLSLASLKAWPINGIEYGIGLGSPSRYFCCLPRNNKIKTMIGITKIIFEDRIDVAAADWVRFV